MAANYFAENLRFFPFHVSFSSHNTACDFMDYFWRDDHFAKSLTVDFRLM